MGSGGRGERDPSSWCQIQRPDHDKVPAPVGTRPRRPALPLLARVGSDTGTRAASVGRAPAANQRGRPAPWTVHRIRGGTRSDGGGRFAAARPCDDRLGLRPRRKVNLVPSRSQRKQRPPSRGARRREGRPESSPCISATRFLDGAHDTRCARRTTRTTLHVAAVTIPAPPAVPQVTGRGLLVVALWLVGA
jgi:hypothetical protein